MITIKRYSNRKLYNSTSKKYITLEEIALLVREGNNIQVIDHETGEDLTTLTLAQIMLERERNGHGLLPQGILARLLQAGEETIKSIRRSILDPYDMDQQVNDEIERRLQVLVDEGEFSEEEGARLLGKLHSLMTPTEPSPPDSSQEILHFLKEKGLPDRDDIQNLTHQIDVLEQEFEKLSRKSS